MFTIRFRIEVDPEIKDLLRQIVAYLGKEAQQQQQQINQLAARLQASNTRLKTKLLEGAQK